MKIDLSTFFTGGVIGLSISALGVLAGVYAKRSGDLKMHSQDREDKSADRKDREMEATLRRAVECEERERGAAQDREVSGRLISAIEGEVTVISGMLESLLVVLDPLCPGAVQALRYVAIMQTACGRIKGRLGEQRGAIAKGPNLGEGGQK